MPVFLATFLRWFGGFFIDKLLRAIIEAIQEYVKTQKETSEVKKALKEKVAEVMLDPDPISRAKRLKDLLGT